MALLLKWHNCARVMTEVAPLAEMASRLAHAREGEEENWKLEAISRTETETESRPRNLSWESGSGHAAAVASYVVVANVSGSLRRNASPPRQSSCSLKNIYARLVWRSSTAAIFSREEKKGDEVKSLRRASARENEVLAPALALGDGGST